MDPAETTIYHIVLVVCLGIGFIFLLVFLGIIRQQRVILSLRKKNAIAEIKGVERDRARIANDLHDDLGPLLSSIKMRVTCFDLQNESDREELICVKQLFDSAIQRIRQISFNLVPNTLIKKGLVKGLREYMELLTGESNICFTVRADSKVETNEVITVNIYRLLQEAVYNAVKHAQATKIEVDITVDREKNLLKCKVTDDGIGFDYKKKLAENGGIGLKSLNNRALVSGGRMIVQSSPGKGTSSIFIIPV